MDSKFGYRYIGEEIGRLIEEPTDLDSLEDRIIGGGKRARYVDAQKTIRRLNYVFGYLWSHKLVGPPIIQGEDVVVYGEMEVIFFIEGGKEYRSIKGQAGGSKIKRYSQDDPKGNYKRGDVIDLGNDVKAAISESLRKCASEYGIYLDVYEAPLLLGEKPDRVTEGQFDTFYFRAGRLNMDREAANQWAKEETGKDLQYLTSNEVMNLVSILIKKEKEKK